MTGHLEPGDWCGKEPGLLAIFILHTLANRPATGYELIKEVGEKSGGAWTPSKGTLYPVLRQLEEKGLIELSMTGSRAKNIWVLTPEGRRTLDRIRDHWKGPGHRFVRDQNLLAEIFGSDRMAIMKIGMEIHTLIHELPPDKVVDAVRVMEDCRKRLQDL